jgi:RES domain
MESPNHESSNRPIQRANLPVSPVRWAKACRLIPSRFPTVGVFDRIASPADLEAVLELEAWTNDRLSTELGILNVVPRDEWVVAQPMASVVMAAFCHPRAGGGRFSGPTRGAWYAGRTVETALAESIFHRTRELIEVGAFETRMEMRLYHADFRAEFADLRARRPAFTPYYDPDRYEASQALARDLLDEGANGIVYRSVRHAGGECLACFRPALVRNVRAGGHYEFRWEGSPEPRVRALKS